MRVLLDTNILARAAGGPPGAAHELFLRLTHHEHVLVCSHPLLEELARVLRYDRVRRIHRFSDSEIDAFVAGLMLVAEVVDPGATKTPVVISDPADDAVVATAIAGRANVLCTLDRHLFQPVVVAHCRHCGIDVFTDVDLLVRLRQQTVPT